MHPSEGYVCQQRSCTRSYHERNAFILLNHAPRIHAHLLAVDTSFIFDYALVFSTPSTDIRIDMTIVPKVYRAQTATEGRSSGFLCRPDGQNMPVNFSSNFAAAMPSYIPRQGDCTGATNRAAPYAAISSAYDHAHPEEHTWLQGRLDKTAVKVQQFVAKAGLTLDATQSRLKIALVHSGGGKRAMIHSLGTHTNVKGKTIADFHETNRLALIIITAHFIFSCRRGPGAHRYRHRRPRFLECRGIWGRLVCPCAHSSEPWQ